MRNDINRYKYIGHRWLLYFHIFIHTDGGLCVFDAAFIPAASLCALMVCAWLCGFARLRIAVFLLLFFLVMRFVAYNIVVFNVIFTWSAFLCQSERSFLAYVEFIRYVSFHQFQCIKAKHNTHTHSHTRARHTTISSEISIIYTEYLQMEHVLRSLSVTI